MLPAREVTSSWSSVRTLLLAVEVVSPSSARGDRLTKRRLYQRQGVATYWIVDPDARLVEVWHPEDHRPEIVTDALTWRVTTDAEELVIDLGELFKSLPELGVRSYSQVPQRDNQPGERHDGARPEDEHPRHLVS